MIAFATAMRTHTRGDWLCQTCGSADVDAARWVNVNTGAIGGDAGEYFCNACDDACEIGLVPPARGGR